MRELEVVDIDESGTHVDPDADDIVLEIDQGTGERAPCEPSLIDSVIVHVRGGRSALGNGHGETGSWPGNATFKNESVALGVAVGMTKAFHSGRILPRTGFGTTAVG